MASFRFSAAAIVTLSRLTRGGYLPDVRTVTIDMAKLSAPANAAWFDPTNNTFTGLGVFPNSGRQKFRPPGKNYVGDEDWVLLLATG